MCAVRQASPLGWVHRAFRVDLSFEVFERSSCGLLAHTLTRRHADALI
jgi:hypothetical protein